MLIRSLSLQCNQTSEERLLESGLMEKLSSNLHNYLQHKDLLDVCVYRTVSLLFCSVCVCVCVSNHGTNNCNEREPNIKVVHKAFLNHYDPLKYLI